MSEMATPLFYIMDIFHVTSYKCAPFPGKYSDAGHIMVCAASHRLRTTCMRQTKSAQTQPKIKRVQGGSAAMTMAAKGEVEIGLTFLSEVSEPGIDIVGPLPREISPPTVMVGFVSTHAKDPAAAKALLDYLSSPGAAAVYQAHGMQPGR
jgi:ABC-type molybdate transport system substrate-binding protein